MQEQKQKRQPVARVAVFKSQPDKPTAYHGVVEVIESIPAGSTLDLTLYMETSRKGNAYLSGPLYIQPAKVIPEDDSVEFPE